MASRRSALEWGAGDAVPADLDVLIPTADRPGELAVTLAGLAAQDDPPFRVVVSDQSPRESDVAAPAVTAMVRVLQAQGREIEVLRNMPRRGVAQQREFLLSRSSADAVLYLDDDVWLEPGSLSRMYDALQTLGCGFVGMAVQGLSYLNDERPHEQSPFEAWNGPVGPERVRRGMPSFERWTLHNAANLTHLARRAVPPERDWVAYKIAWVGGCVMFRRESLVEVGGFSFWNSLPDDHAGEDVLAQWRVMERHGGAGILPSGAVHLEAPTTIPRREYEATELID